MTTARVDLAHDVEEEWIDVVVKSLVIEEAFGEEAEIAAPGLLLSTVDLEEGDVVVAIDLIAGRMYESAFVAMASQHEGRVEEGEAEFADVEHRDVGAVVRQYEARWRPRRRTHNSIG